MAIENPFAGFLGLGNAPGSTRIPKDSTAQWRPPQWQKPAMFSITVPAYASVTSSNADTGVAAEDVNGVATVSVVNRHASTYVFDAVLSAEHEQSLVKTNHPVQTSASISSHAYLEPANLVLLVLMSDVVPQYAPVDPSASNIYPWTGDPSKSISAYRQLLVLQALRTPLIVTTRLRTYKNMLIMRVSPREDDKTITSARFRLELGQVFIADTQQATDSARVNDTTSTGLGSVNPTPVPVTTQQQFSVPAVSTSNSLTQPKNGVVESLERMTGIDVPGAGSFTSVVQQFLNSSSSTLLGLM